MENLVRIRPVVFESIADTQTDRHTHTYLYLYLYTTAKTDYVGPTWRQASRTDQDRWPRWWRRHQLGPYCMASLCRYRVLNWGLARPHQMREVGNTEG